MHSFTLALVVVSTLQIAGAIQYDKYDQVDARLRRLAGEDVEDLEYLKVPVKREDLMELVYDEDETVVRKKRTAQESRPIRGAEGRSHRYSRHVENLHDVSSGRRQVVDSSRKRRDVGRYLDDNVSPYSQRSNPCWNIPIQDLCLQIQGCDWRLDHCVVPYSSFKSDDIVLKWLLRDA